MCGIVGAALSTDAVPFLLDGLKRLEYRGYDSAGLVVHADEGGLRRERAVGQVSCLEAAVAAKRLSGWCGIGHTRWATHGVPSERNSHPHQSAGAGIEVAVVHNGIIENHETLRARLLEMGYQFTSQTDTEVVAHLVHSFLRQGYSLRAAVQATVAELVGAFALAVVSSTAPDKIVATKRSAPLLLGLANEGVYLASDASALVAKTRHLVYLEDGDVAVLSRRDVNMIDAAGVPVKRTVHVSGIDAESVALGSFPNFMLKEIHEQPAALARTLAHTLRRPAFDARLLGPHAAELLSQVRHVRILACGTSFYAGSVARYWVEELAGVPCTVEIASEYRYRTVAEVDGTLVLAISQSGETADTLAAVGKAIEQGCRATLALCNVPESSLTRLSQMTLLTKAGPEIGVASTKAFTTQLASLRVLALILARERGRLSAQQAEEHLASLEQLPALVEGVLAQDAVLQAWSESLLRAKSVLYLGRGAGYPIAQEGALKLKEITYIHAEAYPAGELKHGPLALVDESMPVVVVASKDETLDKLLSNVEEVQARGGQVFGVVSHGVALPGTARVLHLPPAAGVLESVPQVVALQLLAYHTALGRGLSVDRPRNLAKSVTTE